MSEGTPVVRLLSNVWSHLEVWFCASLAVLWGLVFLVPVTSDGEAIVKAAGSPSSL